MSQRKWLVDERNRCQSIQCLEKVYYERLAELETLDFKKREPVEREGSTSSHYDTIKQSLEKCDHGFRSISVNVPASINLAERSVAFAILRDAAVYAASVCPNQLRDFENISVVLRQNGVYAVTARNYDKDKLTWFEYINIAANELNSRNSLREDRARRANDISKLESKLNDMNTKARDSEQAFSDFLAKNNITKAPSYAELQANPFRYNSDVIAIPSSFVEMLDNSTGLLSFLDGGQFILSGIPTNLFSSRTPILLAAKVIGKTQQQVLHFHFVDVLFCSEPDCLDVLFWKTAGARRDNITLLLGHEQRGLAESRKRQTDLYFNSIYSLILGKLNNNFHPKRSMYTAATLSFKLTQDGEYSGLVLASTSGEDDFDNALIKAITSIERFSAFPDTMPRQTLNISLTINYKINHDIAGSVSESTYNLQYQPHSEAEHPRP
jgi:hypothetical protein